MSKKLPIYDIVLDENNLKQGVGMISLVDEPAIMVDWVKLANETEIHFNVDKDKQLLYGPFLIPDMLIYRADEKLGQYYVRFKREQIEKIANKFNEDLNNKNLNFQHSDVKVDAVVSSNWIIEGKYDKSQNYGFDLPEGTWFGSVKVKDENFWKQEVKTDKVKGFSVEILADLELQMQKINQNNMSKETELEANASEEVDKQEEVETNPAETQPVVETQLSREDVATMIDARFQDIMNEITSIKTAMSPLMNQEEASKFSKVEDIETLTKKISDLEEKLGLIPAAPSIKHVSVLDKNFNTDLERIRTFAKMKGEQK